MNNVSPLVKPKSVNPSLPVRKFQQKFSNREFYLSDDTCLKYKWSLGLSNAFHGFFRSDSTPESVKAMARLKKSKWKVVLGNSWGNTPWVEYKVRPSALRTVGVLWWNDESSCPEFAAWNWDFTNKKEKINLIESLCTNQMYGWELEKLLVWFKQEGEFSFESKIDLSHWTKIQFSEHWSKSGVPIVKHFFDMKKDDEISFAHEEKMILEALSKNKSIPTKISDWLKMLSINGLEIPVITRDFWAEPISSKHYSYILQEISAIVSILGRNFISEQNDHLDLFENGVEFLNSQPLFDSRIRFFSEMSDLLSDISFRGLPWNSQKCLENIDLWKTEMMEEVNSFFHQHPSSYLISFKNTFTNVTEGVSSDLQQALEQEIRSLFPEVVFQNNADGKMSFSTESLKIAGIHDSKAAYVYNFFVKVQNLKSKIKTAKKIQDFVSRSGDSRLHSFIGFGPETDRLRSTDPNMQNFSEELRKLVECEAEKVLISADYGQIELRIAAALAIRSQTEIFDLIDNQSDTFLVKKLRSVMGYSDIGLQNLLKKSITDEQNYRLSLQSILDSFESEEETSYNFSSYGESMDDWWNSRLMRSWSRILLEQRKKNKKIVSNLADVFRQGMDPHLMTGLGVARQNGVFKEDGDILEYLLSHKEKISSLKLQFELQRTHAKPINFGLLYGMTARSLHKKGCGEYDLSWTVQEAAMGSDAYFELYPELELWQAWTVLRPSYEGWLVRYKGGRSWQGFPNLQCQKGRVWTVKNLQGRVYHRHFWRQALNYQDQGTSAELVLHAMDDLPKDLKKMLVNQIHDEILIISDINQSEANSLRLKDSMIRSAENVLGPYNIPVEVEVSLNKNWS